MCGLEQFAPGHDRGSSHGDSRVIRMAYFMHPDYVPVLRRAYELWRELESETGESLMTLTGMLCIGEAESPLMQGLERCYATHVIDHERLTPEEAMRRFPHFQISRELACYWDPYGGFLRPEACVRAHLAGARRAGATLHEETRVEAIEADAGGVTVRTSSGTMTAAKIVLAAGAYTNHLLPHFGNSIQAVRKVLFWYGLRDANEFAPDRSPVWIAQLAGLNFYGFPTLDGMTMKAAEDTGGQCVSDPSAVSRELDPRDEATLSAFLRGLFGARISERVRHKTCLYEKSADGKLHRRFSSELPERDHRCGRLRPWIQVLFRHRRNGSGPGGAWKLRTAARHLPRGRTAPVRHTNVTRGATRGGGGGGIRAGPGCP